MGGKRGSKKRGENGAYPSCGYSTNKPKRWVPQIGLPPRVKIVDESNSREALRKINQDALGLSSSSEIRFVTEREYDEILRQHRLKCRKIILEHQKCKHPEEWSSRLLKKARDKN
jgi:hypothetical protein